MHKTLLLTGAIGASILLLMISVPMAESHSPGPKLTSHFKEDPHHYGAGVLHDSCPLGGKSGFLHFLDSDGDEVHDHGSEREICIP